MNTLNFLDANAGGRSSRYRLEQTVPRDRFFAFRWRRKLAYAEKCPAQAKDGLNGPPRG